VVDADYAFHLPIKRRIFTGNYRHWRPGLVRKRAYSMEMNKRTKNWKAFVCALTCLTATSLSACRKQEQIASNSPTTQSKSESNGLALPMPYGQYTDDLDGMIKRRNIRALVMINPIGFFYDQGHPMGAIYEAMQEFQTYINKKLKTGTLKIQITFIPVRPDQAEAALTEGMGDLVANAVVITPERQERLAFTIPIEKDVKQVLVSGENFGNISSLNDLGGKEVYANPLTVNYERLQRINEGLRDAGKPLIAVKAADKNLLDDDLVQMVNAGLLPATVTSLKRAKLWSQVLPHLTIYPDVMIASGEQTAWVLRKNNPQLKELLDEFLAPRGLGTSFGNTLLRRYLQNTKWVRNSTSKEELQKFDALRSIFERYAGQYDFDYLMIMALGYQESLLDQNRRNPTGATGIMQVIPKFAAASPINVPDVTKADPNVQAGVKMLRNIEDHYFNDPQLDRLDKTLLVFASYNAGPNRIAKLRQQASQQGLDPNKWFNNVELIVAKSIGQETVTYVSNVYKYYVAYKLAEQQGRIRQNLNTQN
jgi:membrane-bound lytic murein transglycosylase MltF